MIRSAPNPHGCPSPSVVRESQRFTLVAPACVLLCIALGCRSGATPPPPPPGQLTGEQLRDLLAKGTIKPVVGMEDEDAFRDLHLGMDDPAFGETPPEEAPTSAAGSDAKGEPAAGSSEGTPPGDTLPVTPTPEPPTFTPVDPPQNPYVQFGARIKVYPDGTITKPYPLRSGTGEKLEALIKAYGNFPLWTTESGQPSPPHLVKIDLLPGWDVEIYQNVRDANAVAGAPTPLADWLVITTGPELLQEVEDFINLFAAGVPQIEIEAKIVEVTLTDVLDIGVRSPPGTPMFQFPSHTFVKSFDSSMPNVANGVEGLLTVGGVQDALTFNATLEALAINDNVSIISRPKIAVREGGRADISNTSKIPFLNITGINNAGGFTNAAVGYQEVGVKLFVVPRVVGTQTVALNIDVEQSQISGSETVLLTSADLPVQVPVVSQRSARTVVYLQPGQAVILGGLITERNVENVRKVPLLGDIPLVGWLFRSRLTRKEQTNVLFFIRPRILQGIDLNREF